VAREPKRGGINKLGMWPEWEMDNHTGQWREPRSFLMTFLLLLVNFMPSCNKNLLGISVLCSSFLYIQFSLVDAEKKRKEKCTLYKALYKWLTLYPSYHPCIRKRFSQFTESQNR